MDIGVQGVFDHISRMAFRRNQKNENSYDKFKEYLNT